MKSGPFRSCPNLLPVRRASEFEFDDEFEFDPITTAEFDDEFEFEPRTRGREKPAHT